MSEEESIIKEDLLPEEDPDADPSNEEPIEEEPISEDPFNEALRKAALHSKPPDRLTQIISEVFRRYDYNDSDTMNDKGELMQLVTNVCFKLKSPMEMEEVEAQVGQIEQSLLVGYSLQQVVEWFWLTFGPRLNSAELEQKADLDEVLVELNPAHIKGEDMQSSWYEQKQLGEATVRDLDDIIDFVWCLVFVNPVESMKGEKEQEEREEAMKKIRKQIEKIERVGLVTRSYTTWNGDEIIVEVGGCQALLEVKANQLLMNVKTRPWTEVVTDTKKDGSCETYEVHHESAYDEFLMADSSKFWGANGPDSDDFMFQSKSQVILVQTIMEQEHSIVEGAGGAAIKFKKLQDNGLLNTWFPLHGDMKQGLLEEWANFSKVCQQFHKQPIDAVQDYLGVKIALYFSYVTCLTYTLYPVAVIGAVIWLTSFMSHDYADKVSIPFAVIMMLWTMWVQYYWDRVRITQVHSWGMIGMKANQVARPAFEHREFCQKRHAYIRAEDDVFWYKLRMFIANLAVVVITLVVGFAMIGTLYLEDWLQNEYEAGFLAGVVNGCLVPTFKEMFKQLATLLVDWEDHRVQSKYDNNLIAKSFGFQFINCYSTVAITAFVKSVQSPEDSLFNPCPCRKFTAGDLCDEAIMSSRGTVTPVGCECLAYDCVGAAGELMITILLVGIVVGNTMEILMPWLKARIRRRLEEEDGVAIDYDAAVENGEMSAAELQTKNEPYGSHEAYDDMSEMTVQYGFLALFAFSCQIAPLLAVLNNWVEIRSDSKKMLTVHQRPTVDVAEDLGIWDTIRMLVSLIAMTSNAAYIFFVCPTIVDNHELNYRFWAFFTFQYIALGVYCFLFTCLDTRPSNLRGIMDIEACDKEKGKQLRAQQAMLLTSGPIIEKIREHQHTRFSSREPVHLSTGPFLSFGAEMEQNPPVKDYTCRR